LTTPLPDVAADTVYPRPVERGREGGVFPGPATFGDPSALKNTEQGVPDVVFRTLNMHKIHFRDPAGELTMFPQTRSQMVGGTPSHVSSLLDAFGISISAYTE